MSEDKKYGSDYNSITNNKDGNNSNNNEWEYMVRETSAYEVRRTQGEYTIEDYFNLPDDERKELIDGVFYDMASPVHIHQFLAAEIYRSIGNSIERKKGACIPFVAPLDVQLDCDDKTIVQPDVLILCDKNKLKYGRIYGAPDFVVEVLSPSTSKKDSFLKLMKYENAGVKEYWIVAPDKKRVFVYHLDKDIPMEIYTFFDKVPIGIFDGTCEVDFSRIYERMQVLYEDENNFSDGMDSKA